VSGVTSEAQHNRNAVTDSKTRLDYVSRRLQETGSDHVDVTSSGKPCHKHRGDWKSSVTMVEIENHIWQTGQ